jgi:hypothetical protein
MEDLNANVASPLGLSLSFKGGEFYLEPCSIVLQASLFALVLGALINIWCKIYHNTLPVYLLRCPS